MKNLFNWLWAFVMLFSVQAMAQQTLEIAPVSEGITLTELLPTHELVATDEIRELRNQDPYAAKETGSPLQVGVILDAELNTRNAGVWSQLPNGDRVWRLRINSDGAEALNLYFDDLFIPQGATVHLYNDNQSQMLGAYTSLQNSAERLNALPQIFDDNMTIEYYEPANVSGQGRLEIGGVGYGTLGADYVLRADPCQVDVVCSPEGDNWCEEANAVVRLVVTVGGSQFLCTGSMVNNVRQDCTPYMLSAYHCFEGASVANYNQLITYFKYQLATCTVGNGSDNPATGGFNSITGSTRISHSNDGGGTTGSDYALVRLNSTPNAAWNVYYAGWDANNTPSASGVSIHHPAGAVKKISTYTTPLTSTTWGGTPNTHWLVYWVATANGHGVTEGGSSGSPIFNPSGRIVGTLTGGGSYCTATGSPDRYGKMSYHWNSNAAEFGGPLSQFLDPDNTGTLTLDGIYSPCSTPDPACVPAVPCTNYTAIATGTPIEFTGALPAGWVASCTGNCAESWKIAYSNADLANIYGKPEFAAPTAAGGHLLFDSDANGNGAHDARVTSSAYNCAAFNEVWVKFHSQYRSYSQTDQARLGVSTNGSTFTYFNIYSNQNTVPPGDMPIEVDISSVAANSPTVYLQFRWEGDYEYHWLVDDIEIRNGCEAPANYDARLEANEACEYTVTPYNHVSAYNFGATVYNDGIMDLTGVQVAVDVYEGATLVYSEMMGAGQTIAASGSAAFTSSVPGAFTPSAEATYTVDYNVIMNEVDENPGYENVFYGYLVDPIEFARDDLDYSNFLSVGPGTSLDCGNLYTLEQDDYLDSILFIQLDDNIVIGDTVRGIVYGTTAGVPNPAPIAVYDYIYTAADTGQNLMVIPTNGLALTAGEYLIGVQESYTNGGIALAVTTGIETPGKQWYQISGTGWTDLNGAFPGTWMVRAELSPGCKDNYNPNQSFGTAVQYPADGINGDAYICQTLEEDWFYFATDAYTSFKVYLTCLPDNFQLEVFDDTQTLIASSLANGQTPEKVIVNGANTFKNYFVRITGRSGAWNDQVGYCLHVTLGNYNIWNEEDAVIVDLEENETGIKSEGLSIYPNPVVSSQDVTLTFDSNVDADAVITLTDVAGRVVASYNTTAVEGANTFNFSTENLSSGLYFVTLRVDGQQEVLKLEVVK